MKTPALEIDEALQILKPLLHRCTSSLTVRNDLLDVGVYLMSHWILAFLMVRMYIERRFNSVGVDVLTFCFM